MTTLVTGGTGFLGRHLIALLAARGDRIRTLAREGTDASALAGRDVEVARGDVLDPEAVRRAAAGCGLVFHLAGLISWEQRDLPRLTAVNVDGVRTVLDAVDPGARVVHVSSVSALGPAPAPDRPADEQQELQPWAEAYPYARTKRDGERVALEAAARGQDVVVANPGYLIGPGDLYRVSTFPVGRYLRGILRVTAPGGLSYADARDVAAGLVALSERGRAGERTILTNRDGNLSHAAFFRRVGELTGVRRRTVEISPRAAQLAARLTHWPVKPGEVAAAVNWWFYDPAKAERELGYASRPIDDTILDTAADYLRRG
jgi:dihydroflavonol-4-reductase